MSLILWQSCKAAQFATEQITSAFDNVNYYQSALGNESVRIKTETNSLITFQQNQKSTDDLNYTKCKIDRYVSCYKDEQNAKWAVTVLFTKTFWSSGLLFSILTYWIWLIAQVEQPNQKQGSRTAVRTLTHSSTVIRNKMLKIAVADNRKNRKLKPAVIPRHCK